MYKDLSFLYYHFYSVFGNEVFLARSKPTTFLSGMGCNQSAPSSSVPADTLCPYLDRLHPIRDSDIETLSRDERRVKVTFADLTQGTHIKLPGFVTRPFISYSHHPH